MIYFFIYFSLTILFLFFAFLILKKREIFLKNHPEIYDPEYDGGKVFKNIIFAILRIFIKSIYTFFSKIFKSIFESWVKIAELIHKFFGKIHEHSKSKLENKVSEKRVFSDFWQNIKKHKKYSKEEEKK